MKRHSILRLFATCGFIAIALAVVGCGPSGPELGTVHGKVTLDGEPLPMATITFQPNGEGSPSFAETIEDGTYTLYYTGDRPGALVGTHTVRIETERQLSTEDGGGMIPEKVPPKYNRETGLTKEVKSGDNEIDFPLTTK